MTNKIEYTHVRINEYNKDHPNAYARIDEIHDDYVVSNMNMPYQGTFSHAPFPLSAVTLEK